MSKKRPIRLAGLLEIPEEYVSDKLAARFEYDWVDQEWEEMLDEDGEPILKRDGTPRFAPVKVKKSLVSYKKKFSDSGVLYQFPRGDLGKLQDFLRKRARKIRDKRVLVPLGFNLKLKKKVRRDDRWHNGQKQCVKEWMEHGYGIVKGDTGSGKTVIGAGLICKLGMTTLILTKRKDGNKHWIKQIRKLTNIEKLEHSEARRLIGVYDSKKGHVYPITVATVQSFRSKKGRKDLKRLKNYFGFVLGDECHELVTPKYRSVPISFNAAAIAGLTATDERDDHLHYIEYDIFGPVVTRNLGRQLDPEVTLIFTGVKAPGWIYQRKMNPGFQWHLCMKALIDSKRRFDIIQKFMMEDIEAGLRVAAISVQRREIVLELAKRLRQAGYKVAYVDGTTKNRQEIYDRFNAGKYDVLCAGKVLNALVDIQTLNCVHMVAPIKSHKATRQVYGRARELQSVIRDYMDEGGQLGGAAKSRIRFIEENGWETREIDMTGFGQDQGNAMGVWKQR